MRFKKKRRCDYFSIPLSWKFENTLELQQGAAGGIWTHDREVSALLKPQPPMLTKLCLVSPLPHNSSEWSSFCSRREREEGRRLSAPQRPSRKNCKHMDTLSVLCFHSRVGWTGIILRYIRYRTSDLIARSHDSRIFTGNYVIFFLNWISEKGFGKFPHCHWDRIITDLNSDLNWRPRTGRTETQACFKKGWGTPSRSCRREKCKRFAWQNLLVWATHLRKNW